MIDTGVPASSLKGSWAGATGGPQFMPSVFLRLARDGDGDGRIDIWNSDADTLASIANYFVNAEIGRAHSELQSLMRSSYAVFCLKKKNKKNKIISKNNNKKYTYNTTTKH